MTWDEIEEMGLGQLRLTPFLLYGLTFAEFGNAMAGHYKEIEEREKAEWERTRWLAAITINPHVKKKDNPERLGNLPMGEERKGRRWNWYLATVSKVKQWQN